MIWLAAFLLLTVGFGLGWHVRAVGDRFMDGDKS